MIGKVHIVIAACLLIPCGLSAQKQLIFMRKGEIVARYTEGDNFQCVLKNKKQKGGYIVELEDFRMVTSNDTINFLSIAKIDSRRQRPINVRKGIGGFLFLGGIMYMGADQVNSALGYATPGWDKADWGALIGAGVGAGILFIRPKYEKLRPGTIIRAIDHRSPFYILP